MAIDLCIRFPAGTFHQTATRSMCCTTTSTTPKPPRTQPPSRSKQVLCQTGNGPAHSCWCSATRTVHHFDDVFTRVLTPAGLDLNCGNFLAQHTVAAVQSEKLSESDVDRAKAKRRRSPAAASVNSRRRRGPARRTTRLGHALEHLPAASCGWPPSARSGTVVQVPVQVSNDALASSWRGTPAPRSTSSSNSCSRTTGQCRRRSLTLKFSNTRRARAERSAQDLHKVSSLLCFVSKICCSFSMSLDYQN